MNENREGQTPLPNYYFDTVTGQLLMGETAIEVHVEAGGNPLDVQELGELLRDTETIVQPDSYERMEVSDWSREDFLAYGRWLLRIVANEEQPHLNVKIINKAARLGIGPSPRRIRAKKRFDSISNYYHELGLYDHHTIALYKDWEEADFLRYIERVVEENRGSRPTVESLYKAAQEGKGPSPTLMRQYGGVGALIERIGILNIHRWDKVDFIAWGVKFMRDNNGRIPTSRHLQALSVQKKGPSDTTTINRFDSFRNFQDKVIEQYTKEEETRKLRQEELLGEIEKGLRTGTLHEELFSDVVDEAEKMNVYVRYKLVKKLLPDEIDYDIRRLARKETGNLTQEIVKRNTLVTEGEVEATAVELGVFDDIWPIGEGLPDLRITKMEHNFRQKRPLRRSNTGGN